MSGISRFKKTLFAIISILVSGAAFACGRPGDISAAYYSAVVAGDYETTAKMFHPDGVSKLRSRLDFMYETDNENLNNFWQLFGEDASPETVKVLTDQEFFEVLHALTTKQSTAGELMRLDSFEVLGAVLEGDLLAHVLVRIHSTLTLAGKQNFYTKNKAEVYVDVQTLRCLDGKWMVERDDGVDGLVFALESQRDFIEQRNAADSESSNQN